MVSEPLLEPDTFKVLERVPVAWWQEGHVCLEIAIALSQSQTSVKQRIAHLISLGLVERRRRQTIEPATEIRKVGK